MAPVEASASCEAVPAAELYSLGAQETCDNPLKSNPAFCAAFAVMAVVPNLLVSADDVAVTVTSAGVLGAVKSPVLEICPEVADHVTEELKLPVPVTVAEHCDVCPDCRMVAKQETVTEVIVGTGGVLPPLDDEPPPQLAERQAAASTMVGKR